MDDNVSGAPIYFLIKTQLTEYYDNCCFTCAVKSVMADEDDPIEACQLRYSETVICSRCGYEMRTL